MNVETNECGACVRGEGLICNVRFVYSEFTAKPVYKVPFRKLR